MPTWALEPDVYPQGFREAPGFGYVALCQPRDQPGWLFALAWPMLFMLGRTPREETGLQDRPETPDGGAT